MEPLNFDGVEAILGPWSLVGQKSLYTGSEKNNCFGITREGIRCRNPLLASRQEKVMDNLKRLDEIALEYEESDDFEVRISLAGAFFTSLKNLIEVQHCCRHKKGLIEGAALEKWQQQVDKAHCDQQEYKEQSQNHDENSEDDEDDNNDSNASIVFSSYDTPRRSHTVTPSSTPQTGKVKHLTASAKTTRSAESDTTLVPVMLDSNDDDDDTTPPESPTPCERSKQKQQKQLKNRQSFKPARLFLQDERREPSEPPVRQNVSSVASAVDDPFSDAATATEKQACCKDNGFLHYKDCYMGTDYLHIIETMQSGYAHYKQGTGRLYVLRDSDRDGLFKLGFSQQRKIKTRWQATPCSKLAVKVHEPVFVSAMFLGARKAEALVKASLRHRKMGHCHYCNKHHSEWFWVEENVILSWVHAWTSYVQSDIFDAVGYPTMVYHDFATRLLRITPERIHNQLKHIASPLPSSEAEPDETVAISATADVPLPPKPTPKVSSAATSIQRFVRRAVTWDSGESSSLIQRVEKAGNGLAVVIQEVRELEDQEGKNGSQRRSLRQKKAPQAAAQVVSKIPSGISGMVKRGMRFSKRA